MKTEEDIRLLRADLDTELRDNLLGDNSHLTDWVEEMILRAKIELLDKILETKDNSFYG